MPTALEHREETEEAPREANPVLDLSRNQTAIMDMQSTQEGIEPEDANPSTALKGLHSN